MIQKLFVTISMIISVGLIWFALSLNVASKPGSTQQTSALRVEQGVQIIHILARGGYSPQQVVAKANMPTMLEVETKGTYDCSSALRISKLDFQESLPSTGITKVNIPAEKAQGTLDGVCAMGMYSFQISFQG